MPASSRRKGVVGEREVAALWRDRGFTVRNLEGQGDHLLIPDVTLDRWSNRPLSIHQEVKRQERIRIIEWLRQAADEVEPGAIPVVTFRPSRSPWYSALPTEQLIELVC